MDRVTARAALGLDQAATVLAFVGQLRPYKGLDRLCQAFSRLPDDRARLLIAGQSKSCALARALGSAAALDPRIHLSVGFVADDDLQIYLRAADLVVLPFTSILNSGSALLALSFERPVLVPHTAPLVELGERVGHEWVVTYRGGLSTRVLADAMAAAVPGPTGRPALESFEWCRLAADTADAFRRVCVRAPLDMAYPEPGT